jgi:hypothetical protein
MNRLWKPVIGAGLTLCLCVSARAAMTPAEANAWREDLHFMAKEMEATHKNLHHSISARDFNAMVAALDQKMSSLTRPEAIVGMARIVAAVGDGHTNIYPTRDPKIGFRTLPVIFTYFGDQLYVRAVRPEQRGLLGARVTRIGNLDVADAWAAARTMIGSENEGGARYWAQYLLAMPEVLASLHITSSIEDVPLVLATAQGPVNATLHPFAPVEIMTGDISTLFRLREGWIDAREVGGGADPLWLRKIDEPFHFEHTGLNTPGLNTPGLNTPGLNTLGELLYVQINIVNDGPNETLARFAQRLHDEIATTGPDKVVIDLRQNRGGNGTLITPLIRAIVQSESVDRAGHLFAIIGPATFSAAQMLADALEKYTKVIFVGEPSGSKGNAYGDSRRITLPNSGITVRAAIYYWQDWHPLDQRDAILPQLAAPLTFEDYSRNVDPALAAIVRYRK